MSIKDLFNNSESKEVFKKQTLEQAAEEIEGVDWIPQNSKKRILSMVKDRPDWCVSRQRNWGVPITIFVSKETPIFLRVFSASCIVL